MNTFHEINMLTLRGDITGALILICNRNEGVARKIMKKAGYHVTPDTGRAFWTWVQETLTRSAHQRRCGYHARAERQAPFNRSRLRASQDYDAYAQMMQQCRSAAETTLRDIVALPEGKNKKPKQSVDEKN